MDLREYFMDELWPLLDNDQKRRMIEIAEVLARYAPPPETDTSKDTD